MAGDPDERAAWEEWQPLEKRRAEFARMVEGMTDENARALWMVARSLRSCWARLRRLRELRAPFVIIKNEQLLVAARRRAWKLRASACGCTSDVCSRAGMPEGWDISRLP